jgi:hypothetical protein
MIHLCACFDSLMSMQTRACMYLCTCVWQQVFCCCFFFCCNMPRTCEMNGVGTDLGGRFPSHTNPLNKAHEIDKLPVRIHTIFAHNEPCRNSPPRLAVPAWKKTPNTRPFKLLIEGKSMHAVNAAIFWL